MVACSIAPLSETEIQLACFVGRGGDAGDSSLRRGALFLNILKVCGPIIEKVDGLFHFVHFTAREYGLPISTIFHGLFTHCHNRYALGLHNYQYLTEGEAHATMSSLALRYLSSTCFDSELTDDKLQQQVLRGAFVFQSYVCSHWPHHLKSSTIQPESNLKNELTGIVDARENEDFVKGQPTGKDVDCFRFLAQGYVLDCLADALDFHRKRKREMDLGSGGKYRDAIIHRQKPVAL